ncbi:MAG: hypothetical protein AB8B84_01965 [Granulosicoccus sp.]
MRPHIVKSSLALFIGAHLLLSPSHASQWSGSYSTDGQCYCVGELGADIMNTIVPTPIGGQTVAQVCKRIGAGPGLIEKNGEFNYPVYKDPQCGHGPFKGEITLSNTSDNPSGAQWDLKSAFAKNPKAEKPKVAQPSSDSGAITKDKQVAKTQLQGAAKLAAEIAKSKNNSDSEKPVVISVTVQKPSDTAKDQKPEKNSVVSKALTTEPDLAKKETLPPFTGKVITIEGKRYMQARDDIPAKGGKPGSKIILDGKVYLLDDGSIPPKDLYRRQFGNPKKKTSKAVDGVNGVAKTKKVAVLKKPKDKSFTVTEPVASASPKANVPIRDSRNQIPREPVLPEPATNPATELSAIKKSELLPTIAASSETIVVKPQVKKEAVVAEADLPVINTLEQVAAANDELQKSATENSVSQVGVLSALKLPASVRSREDKFSYVEAMPANFDVGGNGVVVKGSTESHSRFHYVGRVAVTNTYQEVMIGGGMYLTPRVADRFTMVLQAGVEHGTFQLEDDQDSSISVNYGSSGLYFGAATRMVINRQMELRGGLGYSTFFKGDLKAFGGAYWHLTPHLDVVSRFELGDNDLLGLGIRYYY